MRAVVVFGVTVACLAANPSLAQTRAEAGHYLAQQWCSSCHQVEPEGRATDTAPPFVSLANERPADLAWVRTRLQLPRYPMAGINLSRDQIEDIIAYFAALRREPERQIP